MFFINLIALAVVTTANVLQLVTVDSPFKSASQINQFISENGEKALKDSRPIISFINCGSSKGEVVVNKILETNVYRANEGICMTIAESAVALCPSYQNMYQPQKFCGAKAIDYCGSVSSQVCILLPVLDIEESLTGYDQIFRRLFWKAVVQKKKIDLIVLIDNTVKSNPSKVDGAITLVNSRIGEILKEVLAEFQDKSATTPTSDIANISVETIGTDDSEALVRVRQSLLLGAPTADATVPTKTLGNRLHDSWTEVSQSSQRPILTPAQRKSLFQVDTAYAAGLVQTEAMANQWRARVNNGKLVAKFSDRVKELVSGVKKTFYGRTTGTLVVRERADRVDQLVNNILNIAKLLFTQQLVILEKDVTTEFRRDLLEILRRKPESYATETQQAVRDAVYRYKTAAAELEGEGLGLGSLEELADLSARLLEDAKEFPESNTAKLDALRRMDKQVKKPKRKKGKRAVNLTLNLVGMLRPPGYGNLQGFVGYNGLSLFGVPVETLLGVQNDGDAPEILGEDREQPILRLQPKVHFDIDL